MSWYISRNIGGLMINKYRFFLNRMQFAVVYDSVWIAFTSTNISPGTVLMNAKITSIYICFYYTNPRVTMHDFMEFHFDYDLPRRYMRYSGNGIDMGIIIVMWMNLKAKWKFICKWADFIINGEEIRRSN